MSEQSEHELRERNERLSAVLAEARDTLSTGKAALDAEAKHQAIAESLDYAVRAIDIRIRELDRAITRGTVGTDQDGARRIEGRTISDIFEAALLGYGYQILPAEPVSS